MKPKLTRVRMEFTAKPRGNEFTFLIDKKIGALRVMMKERFGASGERAVWEWMTDCARNNEGIKMDGGNDAA